MQEKYRKNGFLVLAFPCNQFGKQEPGTDEEIHQYYKDNFNITFEMFKRIDVNGDD